MNNQQNSREAMPRTAHDVMPGDGFGSIAQQRAQSRVDIVGHGAVQPWSAGDLFPCVIATVERYEEYPPLSSFDGYRAAYDWTEEEQRRNYEGCRAEWYRGRSLASRLQSVSYELIAYGRREEYATHEDAAKVARWLNRDEAGRARWVARAQFAEVQS